jgi:hypothetical protein
MAARNDIQHRRDRDARDGAGTRKETAMSVLKTLRERVAPELNHLYVVPPSESEAGLNCGWRAREHALHTWFVARLFGAEADLCSGDFAVLSQYMPPLTSMGRNEEHGWCIVTGVAPVDLSMTFRLLGNVPQLRSPIVGEGRNGDWNVKYAEDESVLDEGVQTGNEILFIEKTIHEDGDALLANPHLYLSPPAADDTTSWHALHGPGIYARITAHCFGVATGETKSLRQRFSPKEAVAWIAENYADSEIRIRQKLGEGGVGTVSPEV